MPTFRVEKNKGFTVMSNYHLRDKNLSLKAKGLLSYMLSLPEDWDYSIDGLVSNLKEKEKAIKSTLEELKENGYLVINKLRNEKGLFEYEYLIYEEPKLNNSEEEESKDEYPEYQNGGMDYPGYHQPGVDDPEVENGGLILNTNIINTKELNIKYIDRWIDKEASEKKFIYDEKYKEVFENFNLYPKFIYLLSDYAAKELLIKQYAIKELVDMNFDFSNITSEIIDKQFRHMMKQENIRDKIMYLVACIENYKIKSAWGVKNE